jgi:hypothetical protein
VVHNWPNKLLQKLLDEKLLFVFYPISFTVIHTPQNRALQISGF